MKLKHTGLSFWLKKKDTYKNKYLDKLLFVLFTDFLKKKMSSVSIKNCLINAKIT